MKQIPPPELPVPPLDPTAIRPCRVPASAPPFDDEQINSRNGADLGAASRPPDEDRSAVDSVTLEPDTPVRAESPRERPGPPPPGWPSQFAQVVAETLAGSRPARQLVPWTTERARRRIRQLGPMLATDQRPKVRRVMTSAPAANVLEVTAVVGFGPRLRVLALRLELEQPRSYRHGGSRWCCTAIESA
jgi:Family of unknown function (DUF6459)